MQGEDARASLTGASWHAQAASEFGIEVLYVPLDAALSDEIVAAQALQGMTNITRRSATALSQGYRPR